MQARRLLQSLGSLCLGACAAISVADEFVFKSVDETLAAVLGLTDRDAVYPGFLTKCSLTRDESPRHLATFQMTLADSFGPRAAWVLSNAIAKRPYSELHLAFVENPAFGLPEYVEEAKSKLLDAKSQKGEKTNAAIETYRKSGRSEEKVCN